jgi:PAS domain S-box-containing protein
MKLSKNDPKKQNVPEMNNTESKNHTLFENTDEGVVVAQDEKFCYTNNQMEEITGYTNEELTSINLNKFAHPDDRQITRDWYRRRLRGEYPSVAYPFRIITKDLEIKWVLGTSIKIDWNGRPAVLGFITDITPQKQIDDPSKEFKTLFGKLFDGSEIGVFIINLKGAILYINQGFADIFSYNSPEQIITDKFLTQRTNRKNLKLLIEAVKSVGKVNHFNIELTPKKGANTNLCCDAVLHKKCVFGMITSAHHYEQKAKTTGPNFDNHIKAAEKFGKHPENLIGLDIYSLMPDDVPAFQKSQVNKAIRTKRPLQYNARRHGRIYYNKIYPVLTNSGRIKCIAIFADDASKRLQVEKELRESIIKLENMVAEQTKKLKRQKQHFEEANIALRVLFKQREEDKIELESRIMKAAKELIQPYIFKLKKRNMDERSKTYLNILESNVNSIFTPFSNRSSALYTMFTPSEIEVAELIKYGRSSKEIADLLNVSVKTVETHRAKIRKKAGLTNKKVNLRTYLLSFK